MVAPERLTGILRRAGVLADGHVKDVVVASSRDTILSRIIRLRLSHDGAPDAPRALILKTAQPGRKDIGSEEGAKQEVAFYNRIAAAMTEPPVPRCFEAHWDVDTKAWHILLERTWAILMSSLRCGRCRRPWRNVRASSAHGRDSMPRGGTMLAWVSQSASAPATPPSINI